MLFISVRRRRLRNRLKHGASRVAQASAFVLLVAALVAGVTLTGPTRDLPAYDRAQWEKVKSDFWRNFEGKDETARQEAIESLGWQNHIEAAKLLIKLIAYRDPRLTRLEKERARLENQYRGLLERFEKEAQRGKGVVDSTLAEEVIEMETRLSVIDGELNSLTRTRYFVILALAQLTDAEAIEWLCKTLDADKNYKVRTAVAEALGSVSCAKVDVQAALGKAVQDKDPRVRAVAVDSLDKRIPNKVFLACAEGKLFCISGKDASRNWECTFPKSIVAPMLVEDITLDGPPEVVIQLADRWLTAVKIDDGSQLWVADAGDAGSTLVTLQTGTEIGPLVLTTSPTKGLFAVEGKTGNVVWKHESNGAFIGSQSVGDLNGDKAPDLAFCDSGKRVVALKGRDGARLWEYEAPDSFLAPPVRIDTDGNGKYEIVVVTMGGLLLALSGEDGKKLWEFNFWKDLEKKTVTDDEKTGVFALQAVQLSRNGPYDLFALTQNCKALLLAAREVTPKWRGSVSYKEPMLPIALADVDGNGAVDLGIWFKEAAVVWLGGDTGKEIRSEPTPKVHVAGLVADADRDDLQDSIFGTREGNVLMYRGMGGDRNKLLTFKAGLTFPPAATDGGVGPADLEEIFVSALADAHWQVRAAAARALGRLQYRGAVRPLVESIAKEQGRLRGDVDAALKNITGLSFGGSSEGWQKWWADFGQAWLDGCTGKVKTDMSGRAKAVTTFYTIETLSKNLLFVLDISGSMREPAGDAVGTAATDGKPLRKIDVAKAELKKAVKLLPEDARFGIVVYSSAVHELVPTIMEAKQDVKDKVYRAVDRIEPTANTNIYGALERAFMLSAAGKSVLDRAYELGADTIFFMTDGYPTTGKLVAAEPILAEVRRWNVERKIVIHAIGVGDHDRSFIRKLAEQNSGQYVSK